MKISDYQLSWGYVEGSSKGPWCHALLVIADLLKEFWLHVMFLMMACVIKTFDEFILGTHLSDLTDLIISLTACISDRVQKINQNSFD
jgi:hypothetical protein